MHKEHAAFLSMCLLSEVPDIIKNGSMLNDELCSVASIFMHCSGREGAEERVGCCCITICGEHLMHGHDGGLSIGLLNKIRKSVSLRANKRLVFGLPRIKNELRSHVCAQSCWRHHGGVAC